MQNKQKKSENSSTILFVFSGTGNSLNVALKIQENIKNCKILSISKAFKEKNFKFKASKIGFIFPVYFLDIPHIISEFLKKINVVGNPYIFAIATCGGEVGNAFKKINKILHKQKRKLNSEFRIVFPSNSIVMFNKSILPEEMAQRIKNSEVDIEKIIKLINGIEDISYTPTKVSILDKFISWMGKLFLFKILNDRTFRVDENKCSLCGNCVSICPMDNINLINDKLTWGHNCECCAACIHWCPRRAIENIGTKDTPRYHHPEITINRIKSY